MVWLILWCEMSRSQPTKCSPLTDMELSTQVECEHEVAKLTEGKEREWAFMGVYLKCESHE